ncbi:endoribonuclease Dicer homolog 3b-like isoform X2 [Ananas comosus]|uniref:Endoribonuclease Dicer homolog 3b-like isoform X2 n=1 Tax=Ananas comosus TaxID=4615 RepID=A0A6P5FN04_ANACO|nr:endoribonuclease Dicer homolog 3b-like isoform X2 [Ananas comosus]
MDDAKSDENGPTIRRKRKDFNPRSYQMRVLEVALQRNTIAVLDTGTGKTMIAVMLMKEIGRRLKESGERVFIIFLAPTVILVNQQYEVIRDYTDFDVAEYYGATGTGYWSAESWRKEVSNREILLDALRHAFLTLDMVCLMILDECHRACGDHPYTRIMKEFYHRSKCKPSVFGMTASPISKRGASSSSGCQEQISKLEMILDSEVYTVEDRSELEKYSPSATLVNRYYDAYKFNNEKLKTKLHSSFEKIDDTLVSLQKSPSNKFKDTNEILEASKKSLSCYHAKILYCIDNLGLICATEAAKVCIENIHALYATEEFEFSKKSLKLYLCYLEEVLLSIEEILPQGYYELINTECGSQELTRRGYISPKLDALVHTFRSFGSSEEVLCLIFVERIITAKVIERFMKKDNNLSHFSISYLTGGSSSKDCLTPKVQRSTLELFRAGKVNLLFTTDVAEEGIHVPNCSWVIRFDVPKTLCSFVQSRGRARRSNSYYVLMLERGNVEQRDQLFDIMLSEYYVQKFASCRDNITSFSDLPSEGKYSYRVDSTGATVTADSSVSLIHKYCEKLPKDRYFTPKPFFDIVAKDGLYECTLVLPPNAAFQRLVGPLSDSRNLAKQLVSLEACKKLHLLGVLSDHLLPFVEDPMETNYAGSDNYTSGAGTTKRKELHGMTNVCALSGSWAHRPDNVTLNAYGLSFVCDQEGENYSGFILLIESTLDDDVASAEIELFLIPDKTVYTFVSPCGKIQLDKEQVEKAKLFQEFFFNGIFGRLFRRSRCGVQREFLFREGHKILWSSFNMYLLLPLKPSQLSHANTNINWAVIDACSSVVEYLRSIYSLDGEYCPGSSSTALNSTGTLSEEMIHLANKPLNIWCLKDSVVLSIHTGRIYSVLDVIYDSTPESSFAEMSDEKPTSFASFADYYYQKYNIALQHPGQPLLLLKQSHNPHNLLFAKSKYKDGSTGERILVEKEQVHARIPPELLVHIDMSVDILKSFYLLPSVMHRLESLMLASQLRLDIGCSDNNTNISSSLILEAITTLRCCENFSLERLELLGDSVLKYVMGCNLFLKYPKKHEGQLSDHRSRAVCNSTLHKLGTSRGLQGYIRDSAFDPRRWVAPGQISLRPFPCNCGVDLMCVPMERRYITEDSSVVLGKPCDKGHRWMCSKTIADCVEALVGAYYVGGGLSAALSLMSWLGFNVTFTTKLVQDAKFSASHLPYFLKKNDIEELESKLNYRFSVKGLLLEAITHPSLQELGIDYCYQRFEFLGDSVLDLLITWHLFISYKNIDPGELTDMRSAAVSNVNFAQAAVRNNFHHHLQHGSGILLDQITEYVKSSLEYDGNEDVLLPLSTHKAPKVLGDIMESIAGAIFIDADLNLDMVWQIFKPLLSPIITPDKLVLPPWRELIELCSHLGFFINTQCKTGEEVVAEISVQLGDDLLIAHGHDKNRKGAKAKAALHILRDLEKKGISHTHNVHERMQKADISSDLSCNLISNLGPSPDYSFAENNCLLDDYSRQKQRVNLSLKMEKGGSRTALFQLCKIFQWPMPKFEFTERRFRTPIIIDGVATPNFNSFTSAITLHIPNSKVVTLLGEDRTDKNAAKDSAALAMLLKLQQLGVCVLEKL